MIKNGICLLPFNYQKKHFCVVGLLVYKAKFGLLVYKAKFQYITTVVYIYPGFINDKQYHGLHCLT